MTTRRIVVLSGSVRPDNFTDRAVALIRAEAAEHPGIELSWWNPVTLHLPLPGIPADSDDPERLREAVEKADGVILVTPEYHGSMSSVMKLVIDNLGFPSSLSGKPVALVGVAAGRLGAVKALEHLRSVVAHVGGLALPGAVSVAEVQSVFGPNGSVRDPEVEKRIRGSLAGLLHFLGDCARRTAA